MDSLDPYNFYFETPLYQKIEINTENLSKLRHILGKSFRVNAYNPFLKDNTTFSISPRLNFDMINRFVNFGGVEYSILTCTRTNKEFYVYFYFDKSSDIIQKIGQYPSIAEFHINKIKQYDKVLTKKQLKELTRAIGLAANGVGIGSFVYLRRVFEDLIQEAHVKAKPSDDWDEETYTKSRMAERIGLLSEHLPSFLVENKSLYGILSTGIHSLEENECLAHFETVKLGIELILDEKVEAFHKQKKIEEARAKIALLNQNLKKEP